MGQQQMINRGATPAPPQGPDLAVIYDPVSKRWMTAAEIRSGAPAPPGSLGISGGPGQSVGVSLPPMAGEDASQMFDALPQIAGLIGQLVPQLRGAKASFMIPAVTDAIMQKLGGQDVDLEAAFGEGALGLGAHGVGRGIGAVGDLGTTLVKKSLNLAGGPFANRVGEEMLPRLAIREGAEMTREGVDRIAAKANATGHGGLGDLAEALERARLGDSLSPVGGGGGIVSAIRDLFSPPRQLAAGQALAEPFGASTSTQIAPAAEAAVRAFMAWLSSAVPNQQPTQRRPLP